MAKQRVWIFVLDGTNVDSNWIRLREEEALGAGPGHQSAFNQLSGLPRLKGARVRLTPLHGIVTKTRKGKTRSDGTCAFKRVAEGTVDIHVECKDYIEKSMFYTMVLGEEAAFVPVILYRFS